MILRAIGMAGLAAIAAFCFVPAFATNESGQTPPPEQPAAEQPAPEKPKCVTDTTEFKKVGKANAFVIELTNTCEQRYRCTVNAYVVNAQGPVKRKATLTLGPAAKGQATKKAYVMNVKEAGGMASVSRNCKVI